MGRDVIELNWGWWTRKGTVGVCHYGYVPGVGPLFQLTVIIVHKLPQVAEEGEEEQEFIEQGYEFEFNYNISR